MKLSKQLVIIFCLAITFPCQSQDPVFTQFHALPLFYNPAFAGSVDYNRLSLNYRHQWSFIQNNPITTLISYDQLIHRLKGGLGFQFYSDFIGLEDRMNLSLNYSPKCAVKNGTLSPGIRLGLGHIKFDTAGLVFGDQIDPRYGFIYNTSEKLLSHRNFADIGLGLTYNTDRYYLGMSLDHINQPITSMLADGTSRLSRRFAFQGGYSVDFNSWGTITGQTLYQAYSGSGLLSLIFTLNYNQIFMVGTGYHFNKSLPVIAGVKKGHFKLGYSYDINLSKSIFAEKAGGSHEVSLQYGFHWKKTSKEIAPEE